MFGAHCSHVKKTALLWLCLNSWIKMRNRLSSSVSVANGLSWNLSLSWIHSPTAGTLAHPEKFRKHKASCLKVRLKARKRSSPSHEKWLRDIFRVQGCLAGGCWNYYRLLILICILIGSSQDCVPFCYLIDTDMLNHTPHAKLITDIL